MLSSCHSNSPLCFLQRAACVVPCGARPSSEPRCSVGETFRGTGRTNSSGRLPRWLRAQVISSLRTHAERYKTLWHIVGARSRHRSDTRIAAPARQFSVVMRFFKALPALGMVFFGAASVLAQDAQLLIQGIKEITAASADLRDIVGNVTATNVFAQGPKVIDGFEDIVSSIKDIIAAITVPNPTPFPAATPTVARRAALQSVADEVAAVFLEFIRIHQNLLAVVIGKHGIFARTPFLGPLAAILRVLEGVVDTLGTAVILLIPTVADTVQGPFNDLLKTLAEAVRVYS